VSHIHTHTHEMSDINVVGAELSALKAARNAIKAADTLLVPSFSAKHAPYDSGEIKFITPLLLEVRSSLETAINRILDIVPDADSRFFGVSANAYERADIIVTLAFIQERVLHAFNVLALSKANSPTTVLVKSALKNALVDTMDLFESFAKYRSRALLSNIEPASAAVAPPPPHLFAEHIAAGTPTGFDFNH